MKTYGQYYISYEKDQKQGYVASAPAIRGCVVYGKTLKEAHQNITVAIQECLEVREEFKKTLPQETISPAQAVCIMSQCSVLYLSGLSDI
ncbi:MAG: hypothetical protein A2749_00400 [Parcubacteria group bacterium RIFCSPHIGHO2_01_FULL_45_26]|nr:MAG: hypothetical protein A2749_00400 [Parcubacteria group bacterium RIFCSPHIGHO2_01_FULL_45_26]